MMASPPTTLSSKPIYSIGYATKPIETFIAQLQHYRVDVVADIRSVPYSKVFFDYHKENIYQYLKQHNIRYVYLGDEFGPRSKDDAHYNEKGQIQFDRLMQSSLFQQGLKRLQAGVNKGFTVALMCAEKDPVTCHRSQLVGYYLARHGLHTENKQPQDTLNLLHILHDGGIETQERLEVRIMEIHDQGDDLFMSYDERKHRAYMTQCEQTAYCKDC